MSRLHMARVVELAQAASRKYRKFSLDTFVKLLTKMDRKYNVDRLPYWEVMRFSANELELKGKERKVYLSAASKYFSRNRQLRAESYKPDDPPKQVRRRPGSGAVILEGKQFAWKL